MRCVNNFLIFLIYWIFRFVSDIFISFIYIFQTLRQSLKQEGVYVIYYSTEHILY
jgi:hypothetical protein